ncbi:MAG TPA: SdrD B-like domain-containing protein, partial [Gaiellaceae bacterium]
MSAGGITAEPPVVAAPPPPGSSEGLRRYVTGAVFLAPALFLLVVWIVYPAVYTIVRSFFGQSGFLGHWVGIDNYRRLFTTSTLTTAIKNNAIWVAVVPALVTALGLIFAVLTEKVRWAVAFKTAVFLPMAISAFATGVTWRIMYQQDPDLGAVNALSRSVHDSFKPSGVLSSAFPSTPGLKQTASGAIVSTKALAPGNVALLPLTGIPPTSVPGSAAQAVQPTAKPGEIVGVVWRDFKPGGGKIGVVEKGELGLPGVTVELRSGGKTVQSTKSGSDGSFAFTGVAAGTYDTAIGAQTFAKPFGGFAWLGTKLITPSLLIAYIWIWA